MPENYQNYPERGSANLERMRKRSNERKKRREQTQSAPRLQKSYSTESSLHHMVPNSPVHPDPNRYEDYLIISECLTSVFNPVTG